MTHPNDLSSPSVAGVFPAAGGVPTDPQIRALARGVLSGYIAGEKWVTGQIVRERSGAAASVDVTVVIPDLTLAMWQYRDHHGHAPGETREGGEG